MTEDYEPSPPSVVEVEAEVDDDDCTSITPDSSIGLGRALHTCETSTGKFILWPANAL